MTQPSPTGTTSGLGCWGRRDVAPGGVRLGCVLLVVIVSNRLSGLGARMGSEDLGVHTLCGDCGVSQMVQLYKITAVSRERV